MAKRLSTRFLPGLVAVLLAFPFQLATGDVIGENGQTLLEGPEDVRPTQVEQTGFDVDDYLGRAPALRRQVAASLGLDPLPPRTPLNVRSCGTLDSPDFTLEKIEFTSRPGFPVTAHVYVPTNRTGRVPAVLNLHGHWPGAKSSEQVRGRCVQMARMGLVAMAIDAFGSPGEGNERGRLGGHWDNRELAEGPSGYLFATGISVAGISVWDAVRAIDYLVARPEVDPERIVTCGASFGATQALMTAIVDERVSAVCAAMYGSSFTAFPGNNSCELVAGLRRNAAHQEMLALVFPRPLLLIQHFREQPFVEQTVRLVYERAGAGDAFTYAVSIGRHDFDPPKRRILYRWLSRVLSGEDREAEANEHFPFRWEELFCHPDRRVGPEALSAGDLTERVERDAGRSVPVPEDPAAWREARAAYLHDLRRELGYRALREDPDMDVIWREVGAPEELRDAPADARVAFAVPGGTPAGATLRIVGSPLDDAELLEWARREGEEGRAFYLLRLDLVERAYHERRNDWDLRNLTPQQVRYGTNVISLIYGEPHLYRKIRIIRRVVSGIAGRLRLPPSAIRLEARGDEANVLLLAAVLDPLVQGDLELEAPLLSYLRRGDRYPPVALTPPGILRHADVGDLVALLAPRRVTIRGGHLVDGTRPDLTASASPLARAVRTYRALGAADRLEIVP